MALTQKVETLLFEFEFNLLVYCHYSTSGKTLSDWVDRKRLATVIGLFRLVLQIIPTLTPRCICKLSVGGGSNQETASSMGVVPSDNISSPSGPHHSRKSLPRGLCHIWRQLGLPACAGNLTRFRPCFIN